MNLEPRWTEAADDPLQLFAAWMGDAERSEINDPNAVALATATPEGIPSVRMVLMKHVDSRGFAFYTNAESRKGRELADNPRAAMCFHWKSLRRQVRVEGTIAELPPADVDRYFHSRSRRSQLGAAASEQSRPLVCRELLEERVAKLGIEFPNDVPRPEYWRGYVLSASRIEFWADGPDRLHDRLLFLRHQEAWSKSLLFP